MKSPLEKIQDEKNWSAQDLALAAGVASRTAYKNINAENKELNPKILDALAELGYDREKLKKKYQDYREHKRKELLEN